AVGSLWRRDGRKRSVRSLVVQWASLQPLQSRLRSAARSLALRARGFRAISSAVGTTGLRVSRFSLRSASAVEGRNAAGEEPGAEGVRPAHVAKARLTIRSSSEW